MTLFLISFIAGLLTVLAPCVLPLLPVIVGESVTGQPSMRRAVVTILSLAVSLFAFTFILKVSTAFIAVPPQVWAYISGGLLIVFGLISLFPSLWDRLPFVNAINRSSNKAIGQGYMKKSIWGDVIIGAALGPVFSSCSPTYFLILATVLPVSLGLGVLYLSVYIIGLCLSLFAIALLGQKLVNKLGIASDPNGWFKRGIGIIFLVIGIAIIFGFDKTVEAGILSHAGVFDVTQIEQKLLVDRAALGDTMPGIASTTDLSTASSTASAISESLKAARYKKAPELAHPDAYLNTGGQPISLAQYRGKNVVLIDFWTYSCINCQRTLPYLTTWYGKYKDQGLVIIGVHTPEFAFEHLQSNVQDALTRFGITYPVVLDNEYATWNAFNNNVWPREILIDIDGYIVHDHSGEGEYDVTEKAIQAALAERARRLNTGTTIPKGTTSIAPVDLSGIGSPETYFGASRNEYLGNGKPSYPGTQTLTLPSNFLSNVLYLGGMWDFALEYATAHDGDQIVYRYNAKSVYVVASADTPVTVDVQQDGAPIGSAAGADVIAKGILTIGSSRLYKIVANPTAGQHVLQLTVHGTGAQFYTFTFG
jgi:cytochrome c biogenesis protein CcdA/thiol-disulfide isomerase/thioredoxin